MNSIPRVPNQKFFYIVYSNYEGEYAKQRPEKSNISRIMYLVPNFTNLGDLVVDFFASTFLVSKAFLLLPKYRSLVGYDKYDACIEFSKKIIFEVYSHQLLNP